jgi:YfiR/HmsC-like
MAVLSLNFIAAVATGFPGNTRGEDVLPPEYQMKAAYLYNFAKFVDWPEAVLPKTNSPLVIGVLGEDPFDGYLDGTVQNKKIDGHPLEVRRFKTPVEAKASQVLFICSSEKKRWPEISTVLAGAHVLTVGENWEGFTEHGGIINLFMEGKRVYFDVNNEAARNAGLKISSKLLLLRKKPSA